jgi:solute:Na+ symporter, SSS family
MTDQAWQWVILIGTNILLFVLSPWSNKVTDFFKGSKNNKAPNTLLLTSSLVICWLFAKSITNAADLGYKYGMVGGVAYAGYYFSFLVAGILLYQLRTKGAFHSIHHFLETRYGKLALQFFTLLIAFRLLNEIWSNTMIIGSYFGDWGSASYFWAVGVFTFLTLAYTLKGGMQTSIFTDIIQMALFVVLLVIILSIVIPNSTGGLSSLVTSGTWSLSTGLDLFFVAIIQVFSYPFHDPVLTDRGFLSDTKTTLRSFIWATVLGIVCILLFSLVGIFAAQKNMSAPVILAVSKLFGLPMLLLMNTIMLTSAASTIDSTFTSAAKLVHVDLLKERGISVSKARVTMIFIAVFGTIPIFFNPEILDATTISGTMVLGLAPVFLFWKIKAPKASFFLSVLTGIAFGLWYIFFPIPEWMLFSEGKYATLLSINIFGTIGCFGAFFLPIIIKKKD